jgi:hypothetical protein
MGIFFVKQCNRLQKQIFFAAKQNKHILDMVIPFQIASDFKIRLDNMKGR